MRYFLDTEFNGHGGALLSLALVPERGDDDFYVTVACSEPLHPWVERNVIPFLDQVPQSLRAPRLSTADAAGALAGYLSGDRDAEILADWPDDIAHLCRLLLIGPGQMVAVPPLRFHLLPLSNFSPSANSAVPHNALHDARALRDHVLALEG